MALDQGTSSSRAIIYDEAGEVHGQGQQTFDMTFPADGWVEQDPEVLWKTTLTAAKEALASSALDAAEISALGITNQRETTLVWDRETGVCVYNAIVWQDRRTAGYCETLVAQEVDGRPLSALIAEQTGLVIDPYFSSTKLAWILDEVPGVRERAEAGALCFGTVDSFLIWRLTEGQSHCTDATNASRTQLYDIERGAWSAQLLDFFTIPKALLPEVKDSAGDFGTVASAWFGAEIPILGVAGDQQAALIGRGCFEPGQVKSTYGTGCFVMANTGQKKIRSRQNLLATVAYQLEGEATYGLEGSIFVAGAAIKWLRDQLGLIEQASETSDAFADTGGDSGGVFVVPAFTGLGAPHWLPDVRGLITGLTLDTQRAHLVTAFLQSVVYQTEELLRAMAADGATTTKLRVDGGMVVNDHLCQFLADILNVEVQRPADIETTARGAAVLAGLGLGLHTNLGHAAQRWQLARAFLPLMAPAERQTLLAGYAGAIEQAKKVTL